MSRQRGCAAVLIIGFVVLVGGGALVVGIAKNRINQGRVYCEYNLMQLGRFAALPEAPRPGAEPVLNLRNAVPAGTIANPALSPTQRLSWAADALPAFDRKQQDTASLIADIRRDLPWDEGANATAARTKVAALIDYGNPAAVPAGEPWVAQYVGMAGIDPGAAELGLGPPVPPRAGCFRYDAPTPYADIADGLSNSILFAETNRDLGPWLRGGPATVRGVSAEPTAPAAVGDGGQFGGNHPGGGNFGFADGSVRFLSSGISPTVFRALATIAGGPEELAADE